MKENTIQDQILDFVTTHINEERIIIGVLKYGAHIPHLYQKICQITNLPTKKLTVLLSHLLDFFPKEFYQDKEFIILDDTVYEGNELKRLLRKLDSYGVPREKIKTATLIAHEKCEVKPDFLGIAKPFSNAKYISWKERLALFVRQDVRPTERDHPLYYFRSESITLGKLLSILDEYGVIHNLDPNGRVFRLSLTIDSSVLNDCAELSGISLSKIAKVRFYHDSETGIVTAAPMCFAEIDIPKFLTGGGAVAIAEKLGIDKTFFEKVNDINQIGDKKVNGKVLFFYASRAIAGILLQKLAKEVAPRIKRVGGSLSLVSPEIVDENVKYLFPSEYSDFYNPIVRGLSEAVNVPIKEDLLPFSDKWTRPLEGRPFIQHDPILPDSYNLLSLVAEKAPPIKWDGKKHSPNEKDFRGATIQDLLERFGDATFVSAAIDELLDEGLLKARDLIKNGALDTIYTRKFVSGGEYNALQVSRIAEAWHTEQPFIRPELIREESQELWGDA